VETGIVFSKYCKLLIYLPFCREQSYKDWISVFLAWLRDIGIREELLTLQEHEASNLAHYARACTDIKFQYPFGIHELMGIAARGDFDLKQHSSHSGKLLEYHDPSTNLKYIPHVIEPSIGVERLFLALLCSAYREEVVENEKRVVLGLHPAIAPIKACILPLVSNKLEIAKFSKEIYDSLKTRFMVEYDSSGAIGRRYRRADESGTPFCITVDFDSLSDNSVTIRMRDSMQQFRLPAEELIGFLSKEIGFY
jgi:glycyl-tRNA synthetase